MDQVQLRFWKLFCGTYDTLLAQMAQWIDTWRGTTHDARRTKLICFCEGNGLPRAYFGDTELREVYAKADAVCTDGKALELLAAISGKKLPERVIGPKTFPRAMAYGVSRGWRHYFYGGADGIADKLKAVVESRWSGVQVEGTYSPPKRELDSPDWEADIERIRAAQPDILWVALGCPKQEKWCARHLAELGVPIVMPVGAVFDFFTGNVPDTPEWVHRIGCCWLWRLLTGGHRVFVRNLKCVSASFYVLFLEWWRIRVLKRPISNFHL